MIWLWLACAEAVVVPLPPAIAESQGPPQTVVVVVACTLRADRTSVYGNPRDTTPYLRALGEQGVVMQGTMSNAPWTRPAVASLLTGLYPGRLGIDDERELVNTNRGLHPQVETLAERFQAAGYGTVGATANPNANDYFGMAQGFDSYYEGSGLWRDGYEKVGGDALLEGWLQAAGEVQGPLYTQLVLVDTHKPLDPETRHPRGMGPAVFLRPSGVDRYDAALGIFDRLLQRLDGMLAELGRQDRLLVVIGDHGEGLGTPSYVGHAHGRYLYDPNLHVPWVMHGAGVAQGHRVSGLSESIDLHPTLLELAGLQTSGRVDGRSLAAAARGERDETGKQVGFSETWFATDHRRRLSTPQWTLILNDEGEAPRGAEVELYAAGSEVMVSDTEVVGELSWQLDALSESVAQDRLVLELEEQVGEGLLQRLEALGYVDPE